MRQLYYIVVALLLCGACDKQGGYVIRGSFPGLKDGMIVKLNQIEDPFNEINLSIDTVRNGQFELKGVTPSPVFCKITISNKDLVTDKKEIKNNGTLLFLDNSKMELQAEHYDSLSYIIFMHPLSTRGKAKVTGGPLQTEFNHYREVLQPLEADVDIPSSKLLEARFYKHQYSPEEYSKLYEEQYPLLLSRQAKVDAARMDFIRQYPTSPLSLYIAETLINTEFSRTKEELEELSRITAHVEDSVRKPRFLKRMELAQFQYKGVIYTDLSLETPTGENVKLSEHIQPGRYTILDFWASWCGPCKAAIPSIKKLYNEYSREMLDVISVSVDEKNADWQKALKEEKMEWAQLRAAQRESMMELSFKYNLLSIPRLMLVDPEGKVVFSGNDADALRLTFKQLVRE